MSSYSISQVHPSDKRRLSRIDLLLQKEGITRDGNLDYICAMKDENGEVIATGSCFGPTLRCFAVSRPGWMKHRCLWKTGKTVSLIT